MRNIFAVTAAVTGLALAAPALSQDVATPPMETSAAPVTAGTASAPDGSNVFGFEPYFGILGGYHSFDRKVGFVGPGGERFDGAVIEGVLGVNLPLGPVFIGVEGHGAKGFGDINWEYGVRGRAGFRAGDSGLIYGSFGRTWIVAKDDRGFADRNDWVYGVGVEVGPRDIGLGGITGSAGPRLRLSAETYDFKSIRPMAGVVFHF